MPETFTTYEIEPPPGRRVPRWKRQALVRESDREVFVPAACSPQNEHAVFLSACWEGEPVLTSLGHPFVRLVFLEREYRDAGWQEVYAVIRRRLAEERSAHA